MTPVAPFEMRVDFDGREVLLLLAEEAAGGQMTVIRSIEDALRNGDEVSLRLVPEEGAAVTGPGSGETGQALSYRLIVDAGSDHGEHEGLTLRKGRTNLATKVN